MPLEWNLFMIFGLLFLFGHYGDVPLSTLDDPLLIAILAVTCVGLPVLGNFRPDLVSFLPSMRYYAGNWATSQWLFRKGSGAEEKLDARDRRSRRRSSSSSSAKFYDRETADVLLNKGLAFRSMHSHGRALNGLLPRAVDDVEDYDVREGELIAGVVIGWNFGDGHFHDQQLLEAVQERCGFAPGELRVITLESQPAARRSASTTGSTTPPTGLVEEGYGRRRRHGRRASPGSTSPSTSRSRSTRRRASRAAASPRRVSDAIVVGSGPNGLACAVDAGQRGRRGDGARGRRDDRRRHPQQRADACPGLLHDDCSAVHPMAVGSPFAARRSSSSGTGSSGPGPRSTSPTRSTTAAPAVMVRSIEETARGLGRRRRAPGGASSAPPSAHFDALSEDILRPILHVPRHPLRLARFGLPAAAPATAARARAGRRRRRGRCSAASPPTPSRR